MSKEYGSPELFEEIDENLRRAFDTMLGEELPERFKSLIQKLKDGDQDIVSRFQHDEEDRL